MKGLTLALLALGAIAWCANGYAETEYRVYNRPNYLGTLSGGRNPEIPLSPVGSRGLNHQQLLDNERAKQASNPKTRLDPLSPHGILLSQKSSPLPASPGAIKGEDINPVSRGGEGAFPMNGQRQGNPHPWWGMNTTVWTGSLASGTSNRPTSFDFDTSGNFYVAADTIDGLIRILESTDQGHTWNWVWWFTTGGGAVPYSKLIVVNQDSLFFYLIAADAAGKAVVFRANNSNGTWNGYTLRSDSTAAIAGAWDLDRSNSWFHVMLLKTTGEIQYVLGHENGRLWDAPATITIPGCQYVDVAVGNVGVISNNVFLCTIAPFDSAAYAVYDSAGTWIYQKVGGDLNRRESEPAIAASHGTGGDSVRVWVTNTHLNGATNPMIYYAYSRYNCQGASWTKNLGIPGGTGLTRKSWGSSLNIPNWEFGGLANGGSFVNLSWYADSGSSIYELKQNWIWNGWASPTGWQTSTVVNEHRHSASALSYATAGHRAGGPDPVNCVVTYPGVGSVNVYMNTWWYPVDVETGPTKPTPKLRLELEEARPNPFSRMTSIAFFLPKAGHVDLAVYDIVGRKVETLVKRTMSAGSHDVSWKGTQASCGVYFFRLSFEGKTLTNRMVVVR